MKDKVELELSELYLQNSLNCIYNSEYNLDRTILTKFIKLHSQFCIAYIKLYLQNSLNCIHNYSK